MELNGRVARLELLDVVGGAVGDGSCRYVVECEDGVEGVGELAVAGEVLHGERRPLVVACGVGYDED